MKRIALLTGALVLGVTGVAVASSKNADVPKGSLTSTVNVHDGKPLSPGAVGHLQLKNSVIDCEKLVPSLRSLCSLSATTSGIKGDKGVAGANGVNGADGKNGNDGGVGPKGSNGDKGNLAGAFYYSVAYYDKGDTNAGAIATVACKNQSDVAISGGVQVLGLDEGANANDRNTPVSSSFPGRMDWNTNTPLVGRLDGWIIQFGGNAGQASDKDPQKEKVWALCASGLGGHVPVIQTYTQTQD